MITNLILAALLAACVWGAWYFGRKAKWDEMKSRPWHQRVNPRGNPAVIDSRRCLACGALYPYARSECPRCGAI